MPSKSSSPNQIYQIKVTLRDSKPPIWRRLLVSGGTTLYDLHRIIQVAMGWTNSHLHQFIVGSEYYSTPREDDWHPVKNERRYTIAKVAPKEKSKFIYEYDFGDSWEHVILVEKILPEEAGQKYPQCVDGKRACPPEDVGGIWGFQEFLEAIGDPHHPEHESYMEWCEEEYDPEAFDLKKVNLMLQHIDQLGWWDFD